VLESAETELATAGAGTLEGVEPASPEGRRKRRLGIVAWIAIIWLVVVVGAAILAPILPIKDPINGYDYLNTKAGLFKAGHIFGTDDSGNDVFSRVIWGAQASLLIGVGSILFGTLIGGSSGCSPASRAASPTRSSAPSSTSSWRSRNWCSRSRWSRCSRRPAPAAPAGPIE